jgi:hypothetical protein
MTDEQLKQQIAQAEQDAITLDYVKWSFQQRQLKLPTDHFLWEIERDRTLARQRADNATARAKHLDGLTAAKADKKREYDAEIDRELAPQKQQLMRQWLANNPTQTPADFEKKAWIHLRENLVEQRGADNSAATRRQLQASGRYSF